MFVRRNMIKEIQSMKEIQSIEISEINYELGPAMDLKPAVRAGEGIAQGSSPYVGTEVNGESDPPDATPMASGGSDDQT